MPKLGLIGFPLSHSFSPKYFESKFKDLGLTDWSYELFPIRNIHQVPKIIESNPDLVAFNVTIPYKEEILEYCEILSEDVENISAANLIVINKINSTHNLSAYNTDYLGFSKSLLHFTNGKKINSALVMGTGGSSKAIQYALKKLKIPFHVQSRDSKPNYSELNLSRFDLIINCTPVGMHKENIQKTLSLPLNFKSIQKNCLYYDLIYNPEKTEMMNKFEEHGALTKNGLEMLHLQADEAWKIIQRYL
jgi:shikimate dehydrogenase